MPIPARRRCGSPGPADHHLPLTRLEHRVDHAVTADSLYQRMAGCTRCHCGHQLAPPVIPPRVGPATLLATQPGVLLGANTTRARWTARPPSNRSAIVGYDAQEACTTVHTACQGGGAAIGVPRGRDNFGRPAHARCVTSGDHLWPRRGSPPPAFPAHSMSAAAEIRMDPSGSRSEVSSPRAMSAWTQGIVRPSQRAASGRVGAARPSIRVTVATVPLGYRKVQHPCTRNRTSRFGGRVSATVQLSYVSTGLTVPWTDDAHAAAQSTVVETAADPLVKFQHLMAERINETSVAALPVVGRGGRTGTPGPAFEGPRPHPPVATRRAVSAGQEVIDRTSRQALYVCHPLWLGPDRACWVPELGHGA